MRLRRQGAPYVYMKTKFLNKFAPQAIFGQFEGIDLASGELPFEGQTHRITSLCGKYFPLVFYDGAGYL